MNLADEITTVANRYLDGVRGAAEEISATCPFHAKADGSPERTPSFRMSRTTGLWFCHSCKERGNLRQFLQACGISHLRLEQEYGELLEEAARSIPKRLDPLRPGVRTKDPIPEGLLGIFHFVPVTLEQEGFTEETLVHFGVGVDKKHMRITFPLRDIAGQLVGISGRAINDDRLRYKIYDKEYAAWGLPPRIDGQAAKRAVRWNGDRLFPAFRNILYPDLIVVEGFKACMWLHQAGVKNVVALVGSYMSEQQQWILEAMGANVYLMLDNNEAGQKGTHFIGSRLSKGLEVRVIEYRKDREESQPSDLFREEIYDALNGSVDYYRWRWHNRKKK